VEQLRVEKKGGTIMDRKYIIMILSWALGYFGADRFFQGEVALGVIKLITLGAFGVWWLVDAAYYTYKAGQPAAV
jgi:TM2 domain-containing membrane protein YozV